MGKQDGTWQYRIKEVYDGTNSAGEDMVSCSGCGKRIETVNASFSRYDGEPLCVACAQAGEAEE